MINRQFSDAERYLRAGIAYCEDRDLDSWGHYMGAWLAILLAERGRYDEGLAQAEMILRRSPLAPLTTITASVAAAAIEMRRGGDGSGCCSRRLPAGCEALVRSATRAGRGRLRRSRVAGRQHRGHCRRGRHSVAGRG